MANDEAPAENMLYINCRMTNKRTLFDANNNTRFPLGLWVARNPGSSNELERGSKAKIDT